ncbi:MAG: hypothetical protein HKP14_04415, partial [Bacteroidia bacterium]|nr:hypothetical protein [Bacteroidia bacterium]
SDVNSLQGGKYFSPSSASVKNSTIWFYNHYTNPITGCSNVDSIDAYIQATPQIKFVKDTVLIRTSNQLQTQYELDVEFENHDYALAVPTGPNASRCQVNIKSGDTIVEASFSHIPNQPVDSFRIILEAGGVGPCQSSSIVSDLVVSTDSNYANENYLHVNYGAELFPNPSSGKFKLGNLDPRNYNVSICDKWGKFHGVLQADNNNAFTWTETGFFVVVVEHKQSKQHFNLRLLSL